jgi:TPR repeat protein
MFDTGRGVAQDDAEAARWYRLAAEQGHAGAQFNLGIMFANGRGVGQDDAEAARWYRLAAEQGHADAADALKRLLI